MQWWAGAPPAIDANVVACSAATVYRILSAAGLLKRNNQRSKKGTGFQQPLLAHEHWHIDISYLNIAGTFYFMATVLDGLSRSIRTSPYYPQSNGKIERYHRTIKSDCTRPLSPLSLEDAKRGVENMCSNTIRPAQAPSKTIRLGAGGLGATSRGISVARSDFQIGCPRPETCW